MTRGTAMGRGTVTDLSVPNAFGDYGLDFTRYWNSLPPGDSPTMPFMDFGSSGWSHSWGWSAVYDEEGPEIVRGGDGNNETDGIYKSPTDPSFTVWAGSDL